MNIVENFEKQIEEQQQLLNEFKQLKKDRDFYLRVLVQAVITSEGVLKIDPSKSEEALKMMKESTLEFGNGKVCFHKEAGSIFNEK